MAGVNREAGVGHVRPLARISFLFQELLHSAAAAGILLLVAAVTAMV